ncbi:Imm32 family immunity protein [Kitasatospora cheerisanensis]|uniref:Uncharacterized protein n=1 Tax=Kitasatospora cheerisanensis KCTC 2395 TaxID=1348663 RepID=A0A066Z1F2_9ACTN|nr:hypothetical protein [Kitasatospora cheerisanensis]KDN87603.1 hypothetical protein KCH_06160 [Kitasatospora cheerisanensis KCTC 2395]
MRLTGDPGYGEIDVEGTAEELAALAAAVAAGTGRLAVTGPGLTAVEVTATDGPGVLTRVDAGGRVLAIEGDAPARAVLAANLRAMADADDGGHLHLDPHPGHPYLTEDSVPLLVNSPHGGMPGRTGR